MTEDEKKLEELYKKAEKLGVFDELKRIDKKLREDRKRQMLSRKLK